MQATDSFEAHTGGVLIRAYTLVPYTEEPELREYTLTSVPEFRDFWLDMSAPEHAEEIVNVEVVES